MGRSIWRVFTGNDKIPYMNHKFVINGYGAAFLRIMGCECDRCLTEQSQVNCSASLFSFDDEGNTVHHVLFDAGEGVTNQLTQSPYLKGKQSRLDWICLTHWHPDHTKDFNRLLASHVQGRPVVGLSKEGPVNLYCRSGTADWMWQIHEFELSAFTKVYQSGEFLNPGVLLPPVPLGLPNLTLTPITVSHQNGDMNPLNKHEHRYCCCGYLIESESTTIGVLWDIDSENSWLENPETPEQITAVSRLKNADHIFYDCTFWKEKTTPKNHASFDHVQRYARVLTPKNSWLVHITAHVEWIGNEGFGWTDDDWNRETKRIWKEKGLPGNIGVPQIGQEFDL